MPKHQVFLVHGMGQYERGWSASTAQQLRALFGSYPIAKTIGLDHAFDFPEITYSVVFDRWRELWAKDAKAIADRLQKGGLEGGVVEEVGNAAGAASGNSFFQTHMLDVLFFRFIRQMAEEVTLEVLTQMDKHLASFGDEPVRYSVICHSLGTSVMYETLHAGLTDSRPLLSSRLPENFISVSNCSKLLWGRGGDLYAPSMGPSSLNHRGMCDRFLDFGHELDPVWRVDKFDPPPERWFSEPSQRSLTYYHATLAADDVQGANIHSLSHYLSHPDVHVPIIRALGKAEGIISKKQADKALADWRANRLQDQALVKLKSKLASLGMSGAGDWKAISALLIGLRQFLAGQPKADGEN